MTSRSILPKTNRRKFVKTLSAGVIGTSAASVAAAMPYLHTSKRKNSALDDEVIIGEGDFQYRVDHQFCQLPKPYRWQTSHGVCIDAENNLYVIHEGRPNRKDHPAIFVFDDQGKFIRAFGAQFQGGGHGIEIRKEGDQEFLYVTAYRGVKCFAKMTLGGEIVWFKKAPVESGVYDPNEHLSTKSTAGRKAFLPTNIAFLNTGGFLLADGYGTYFLHEYDKDANWVRCFGGPGKGDGKFRIAHGVWQDGRSGIDEKNLYVTDRARHTVQVLKPDGTHVKTIQGFGLPANVDTYKNLMVIPELKARVTLLNERDEVVAQLGDGRKRLSEEKKLRGEEKKWIDGQFIHPHDACFDQSGDIFVAEWVGGGRITKLTRVG